VLIRAVPGEQREVSSRVADLECLAETSWLGQKDETKTS
jgi:hypothetical protein